VNQPARTAVVIVDAPAALGRADRARFCRIADI
jgi:hypothetical protein